VSAGGSKYVGGFVGVNALIKPQAPNAPIKRPPGQKKKDFDPSQSSVLRILQQEDQERGQGRSRGQRGQDENGYDDHGQGQQQGQQQGRQIQGQGKMSKGEQWQQQQRQTSSRASSAPQGGGASLQALLERDLQLNPQEDPRVQHNPQLAPSVAPAQAEYRRPGTAYKPLSTESQARPAPSVHDDYPLPERYDYTQQALNAPAGGAGDSFQSSYYPQSAAGSFQSTYPATKLSTVSQGGQSAPRQFQQSYPTGGGYQQYPSSDYGMGGIPACDF